MKYNQQYLSLLAKQYPTIEATAQEIINLQAILSLPKPTEHFLSDIHGEYEAFQHVIKNGSGVIKEKISQIFKDRLSTKEINSFSTLVYYPHEKYYQITSEITDKNELIEWQRLTLLRLIELTAFVARKYTRSKVRKALPADFAYIIEELLYKWQETDEKTEYYDNILTSVIDLGRTRSFIIALCQLIQRLVVNHLHIVGDIYDRGPYPDKIMDELMQHHSLDIQWGNHDTLWIGAASGSELCVANVLRICARYDNLDIVENHYGISIRPLLALAEHYYKEDACEQFLPKLNATQQYSAEEIKQIARMHKAIAMIQFKLEGQAIVRQPSFNMSHRRLLNKIDYDKGTITLNHQVYDLLDCHFPTIDPAHPYQLNEEEQNVIERLTLSFMNSDKLSRHISFLIANGSMYTIYNQNLLYHGCVPLNEDGSFKSFEIEGQHYSGKALFDQFDKIIRQAYYQREQQHDLFKDLVWYLWTGEVSPLFGKKEMTTFERYFIKDKETHLEIKNNYYHLRDTEALCTQILHEFGLFDEESHIINGHTPVKEKKGENPVKANNKLIVIDGGFSKAYQSTTGLAGYTLIYNSFGIQLISHQPFTTKEAAILNEQDIVSTRRLVDKTLVRKRIKDTDIGKELKQQATALIHLLNAYQTGVIKENK